MRIWENRNVRTRNAALGLSTSWMRTEIVPVSNTPGDCEQTASALLGPIPVTPFTYS